MSKIIARENEKIDDLIRRFKRAVNYSGVLRDFNRHVAFFPKSLRRKIKDEEAIKRRKLS